MWIGGLGTGRLARGGFRVRAAMTGAFSRVLSVSVTTFMKMCVCVRVFVGVCMCVYVYVGVMFEGKDLKMVRVFPVVDTVGLGAVLGLEKSQD